MTPASDTGDVIAGRARWHVGEGEALRQLLEMPDDSVDAVVTDPPYSSGGQFRGDRMLATGEKYVLKRGGVMRADFSGDNRDQRSFTMWCALWLGECLRVTKPGRSLLVFTDWRQLPATTDAVQAGGWVWRGIGGWDKGEGSRPRMGGIRSQLEFVVWATKGAQDVPAAESVGCLPGVWRHSVLQDDKFHQTGKPTALMADLAKICPPGGVVLDPFAGSGTTLVAALNGGRRAIGFEQVAEHADTSRQRCAAAESSKDWRTPAQSGLFEQGVLGR